MGATSSEILDLLKVKLPLQMTRNGLSCFLGFQNFPREDPRPPFQTRKCDLFFNPSLLKQALG